MSKTEPEDGNMEQTNSDQRAEEGDNGGKKGKGLDKEHVWVTHGQVWGLTVEMWGGLDRGWQREKNWDNCNNTIRKKEVWAI